MNKLQTTLVVVLAAGATFTAAILQGRWTNRWGAPDVLAEAGKVFNRLPSDVGSWHLLKSSELPAEVRGILQCQDDLQAVFENRDTGEQILVTLLLGPPGPMSVHTPEICYGSVDSVPLAPRQRIPLSQTSDDAVWMVQFREVHDPAASITRVYYAWSVGETWSAVDEPRVAFGGQPYLFKVQIRVLMPQGSELEVQDSGRAFLAAFLPAFAEAAAPLRTGKSNPL